MQSACIKLNGMVFSLESLENLLFCCCWHKFLTYKRKPTVSVHKKSSLDICGVAAAVLVVYSPMFIFPCMLDDGHRGLHYISCCCNKDACSVSHLHIVALKDLIRGWVCFWFSSISLALQVMAVELHLCLALAGNTETDSVNYVSMCGYQSNCTKTCLLVALPMSVAKGMYPSFHFWCLVTV